MPVCRIITACVYTMDVCFLVLNLSRLIRQVPLERPKCPSPLLSLPTFYFFDALKSSVTEHVIYTGRYERSIDFIVCLRVSVCICAHVCAYVYVHVGLCMHVFIQGFRYRPTAFLGI